MSAYNIFIYSLKGYNLIVVIWINRDVIGIEEMVYIGPKQ